MWTNVKRDGQSIALVVNCGRTVRLPPRQGHEDTQVVREAVGLPAKTHKALRILSKAKPAPASILSAP